MSKFTKGQTPHNKIEGIDHGHHLMYNRGCRCVPCTEANTLHVAQRIGRHTREQLRELPCKKCGKEPKLDGKAVGRLCYNENSRVRMNAKNRILTPEQYEEMFTVQGGLCAICMLPETAKRNGKVKQMAEDHIHGTTIVRGLLCANHNTGIGLFGDDPDLLEAAAFYLRRTQDV